MTHTLVDTPSALTDALLTLQGPVALDTEFHAERRYRPSLMLVQFCDAKGPVFIVDTKELRDLSPIAKTLQGRELIGHALHQDLVALDTRTQLEPSSFCDPQILAGLAGYGYPRRLEELLQEVLDVEPAASHTMSNWSSRPLTHEQLDYAGDDAAHLHAIWTTLSAQVDAERIKWAQTLSEEASQQSRKQTVDDEAWKGIPGSRSLTSARARETLRLLIAWREAEARKTNQAPRQVISDHIAIDLARRRPAHPEGIAMHRLAPKRVARDFSESLLACISRAETTPVSDLPPPVSPNIPQQSIVAKLHSWALEVEAIEGISARLLLPQSMNEGLVSTWSQGESIELPGDWRESRFGDAVRSLLHACEPLREACARRE